MRKFVVLFATVALLLQAGTALAINRWGANHWASDNLNMTVSDSGFDAGATSPMLDEWRVGNLNPQFEPSGKGQVVVTTGRSRLWLGRAQIWVDGSGHVTKGQVKMNTTLLAQLGYGPAATKQVLCQELGHIFGLAHTTESSCMNDTGLLGAYQSPNDHDFSMLNTIYGHTDGGSGGGGGGGGGGDCPPKSNSPKCNAQSSGRWVTIDTFWAPTGP